MSTFWYVKMPDVTAGYGKLCDLIAFFYQSSYNTICLKTFIKLHLNIGHNYDILYCHTYLYVMEGRSIGIQSKLIIYAGTLFNHFLNLA